MFLKRQSRCSRVFVGEDYLSRPEVSLVAGEGIAGEPYRERNNVGPILTAQGSTGRDRTAPWNEWVVSPTAPFLNGRSEWRYVDGLCEPIEPPEDPCAPPVKVARPCTLGSFSGLFAPYRTSALRMATRSYITQNWTHGQSWSGSRIWLETEEKANDLQSFLEPSGFGGLYPFIKSCSDDERGEEKLESVTVLIFKGEVWGEAGIGVSDTFAPNTGLLAKSLGDALWLGDEIKLGFQPWLEGKYDPFWADEYPSKPIYNIKKTAAFSAVNGLRGGEALKRSTPWWEIQPQLDELSEEWNENSLSVRTTSRVIGTASGDLSTYSDLVA